MKIDTGQIISGVIIGLILGIGGTLILQGQKIARLEERVEALSKKQKPKPKSNSMENTGDSQTLATVNPDELIEIIKKQQSTYVKESWGTNADQCFTDKDLEKFTESKTTMKMVNKLKKDNQFIEVVLALKQMPPGDWQKLKELSLETYKPTWAEQGAINRNGQTEAGQRAEKMIAEAIVELVIDLLKKPVEDIKKLYSY